MFCSIKKKAVETFEYLDGKLQKVASVGTGIVVGGSLMASNAMATPTAPSFASLTSSVDYSTAIAAILLVAAGLAGVNIVMAGIKLILPMIKGRG